MVIMIWEIFSINGEKMTHRGFVSIILVRKDNGLTETDSTMIKKWRCFIFLTDQLSLVYSESSTTVL